MLEGTLPCMSSDVLFDSQVSVSIHVWFVSGLSYFLHVFSGKSHAYHAPVTNLGWFHCFQARGVHECWGALLTRKCRLRGLGLEQRPLFLFADRPCEVNEDPALELRHHAVESSREERLGG